MAIEGEYVMFRKLATLIGLGTVLASPAQALDIPAPSKELAENAIYNMLFCDDWALFESQKAIFAGSDLGAVRKIAEDSNEESRVRVLAFNWLREHKQPLPARQLLGVIVEVPIRGGVDVLAAYVDGRVRYINHAGGMAFFEGVPPDIAAGAKAVVASAVGAVSQIGPWDQKRLPPPTTDVRFTFLMSDGLAFGQGPLDRTQRDPAAGPIFQKATSLFQLVVKATQK
jgi:hypothetical protein